MIDPELIEALDFGTVQRLEVSLFLSMREMQGLLVSTEYVTRYGFK